MPIDTKAAVRQIDEALSHYDNFKSRNENHHEWSCWHTELIFEMMGVLERLGRNTVYHVKGTDEKELAGTLRALRSAYANGYLDSVREQLHGETFGNFLDMAAHLLAEGYKDAAAVIAGGTLEQHLRALCEKHGYSPVPDKISTLNDALYRNVYQADWMKQITAWGDIRNNAAHAHYGKVNSGLVETMIAGIRLFMSTYPA